MEKPLEKMTFKELKAEIRRMVREGELTEKELIEYIRSRKAAVLRRESRLRTFNICKAAWGPCD